MSDRDDRREYDDLPERRRGIHRSWWPPYREGHCGACGTKLVHWTNGVPLCTTCHPTRREIIDGIVQPYPHEVGWAMFARQHAPAPIGGQANEPVVPPPSPPTPRPAKGKKPPAPRNQPSLF